MFHRSLAILALICVILPLGCREAGVAVAPVAELPAPDVESQPASRSLGQPSLPLSEPVALDSLQNGLQWVFPFDGSLRSFSPDGREGHATFTRDTHASMPDFSLVKTGEPRFLDGRFGKGLFVEYSQFHATKGVSGFNHFPPAIAAVESVGADAFTPLGGATVSATGAALTGNQALKVQTHGRGDGVTTVGVSTPKTALHVVSVYLRAEGSPMELTLSAWLEAAEAPRAERSVTVDSDWQRVELRFTCSDESIPSHASVGDTGPMRFRISADAAGAFHADGWMLEPQARYGARSTASTWLPGKSGRAGEILRAGEPVSAESGSFAFWTSLVGQMGWRVLLAVGYDSGWRTDFRVDLRDQRRLELLARGGDDASKTASATLPAPLTPGDWHHVAMTWEGARLRLYLDGEQLLAMDDAPMRNSLGGITLGGVENDSSPAVRADAHFDEFAHWDRALDAEEVAALAGREAPITAGFPRHGLFIQDGEAIHLFPRDHRSHTWSIALLNHGDQVHEGLQAHYGIEGIFSREMKLPRLSPGHALDIDLPWSPALLRSGSYAFEIRISAGEETLVRLNAPIQILPGRIPMENAQVISWSGYSQAMAEAGLTVGGIACDWQGPRPHQLATATGNGLYSLARVSLTGAPSSEADRFVDASGKQGRVDQAMPGPAADSLRKGEALADTLAKMPDVRYAIWNCESQWIWNIDFRPATVELARERFGLDLTRWQKPSVTSADQVQHPYGRLRPEAGGITPPESGIIPLDDPLYAFSRWWHSGEPGNEIFLSDMLARTVRERAPQVQNIWEPALRRPAVRVFSEQDILNEWYYYATPNHAIWIQENLAAATRGTRARTTGMPQFLLKPGMAAPYGGMPTPSLFRETVWHCLARPSLGLTYWNIAAALERGSAEHVRTQEEIDALLGERPTWEDASGKIERRGEWSSTFLWIPELRDEIHRMHKDVVHPLGALWPRWENRPRRIAIIHSFAGQLYNNIRWPGAGALAAAVADSGLPFDLLYDQDFDESPSILDGYSLVAIGQSPVITEPMARALRAFRSRGGILLADTSFRADVPGAEVLDFTGGAEERKALQRAEQELLAAYGSTDHVLYIEGMEDARKRYMESGGPTARVAALLREAAGQEVRTETDNVFVNTLAAGEARYVVAVNSLSVPCRWYGHFGRTLGQGLEQTADLVVDASLGKVAYRLPQGERIELNDDGSRRRLRLPLGAADGAVLLFLPEAIGSITLETTAPDASTGSWQSLSASLTDVNGAPVPGVVPVRIAITNDAGDERLEGSGYGAFVDGKWSLDIPIAANEEAGIQRLELTELASGKSARQSWRVVRK